MSESDDGVYNRVSWMVPADDAILRLLGADARTVMNPSSIHRSLGFSSSHVNKRVRVLFEHGLLNREQAGYYTLSGLGEQYVRGELAPDDLEPEDETEDE